MKRKAKQTVIKTGDIYTREFYIAPFKVDRVVGNTICLSSTIWRWEGPIKELRAQGFKRVKQIERAG
jgi:hypothetical protein